MSKPAPVVYLLHGEDDFGIKEFIRLMQTRLGDPSMAEMNTNWLEKDAGLESIRAASAAMPFLAPRRLVVAEGVAQRFISDADQQKFISLLGSLPQTTALALVEYKTLPDKHWLLKWASQEPERAFVRDYPLPQGAKMADWVRTYAVEQGGEFTFQAAALLAESAQDSPRMAALEVDKLLAYVNYQRPVDIDDVEAAAAFGGGPVDYFAFLDAIASHNSRKALEMLERLLDERDHLSLFFSLVGHFRLVLQAREIYENGGQDQAVAKQLKIHPYRAKKMLDQARTLPLKTLESIYLQLQALDLQIKTGQIKPDLALETLVMELSAKQ
ncbi:MAG: DNA polymerase III subunit delta [Anaerolineales bacterium]|nr:DNA polymerase III subunit delta [Anaerolineales bacterium]